MACPVLSIAKEVRVVKSRGIVALAVLLAVLLLGGRALYNGMLKEHEVDPVSDSNLAQKDDERVRLIDFTVEDANGNQVVLSSMIGEPIVLNFWASWCGPCRVEMPEFESAYQAYGERVQFVMVNMTDGSRETTESASQYIEENDYTFPVYFDTNRSAAIAYAVNAIPTTYFIDVEGFVVAGAISMLSGEQLTGGIKIILPE